MGLLSSDADAQAHQHLRRGGRFDGLGGGS